MLPLALPSSGIHGQGGQARKRLPSHAPLQYPSQEPDRKVPPEPFKKGGAAIAAVLEPTSKPGLLFRGADVAGPHAVSPVAGQGLQLDCCLAEIREATAGVRRSLLISGSSPRGRLSRACKGAALQRSPHQVGLSRFGHSARPPDGPRQHRSWSRRWSHPFGGSAWQSSSPHSNHGKPSMS